jgi:Predicted permease.
VKGVIGDYHFESYTQPVKPMVVMLTFSNRHWVISDSQGEGFDVDGIKEIEAIWKKYLPKVPMQLKELRTYAAAQFDDDYRMLRMGFVLLLIAAYVLLTGVFVFTDSVFERHRYVVSVKQLCGASSIRMALEQSHRVFMILCFGVAMALALFSIVFLFYQSNFEVIVVFPWLVTLAGSLFCLLFPGIVFIATHYFLSTRRAFYSDLMKP